MAREPRLSSGRGLGTTVEEPGGAARYVIDGADAVAAEQLSHMGYLGLGDGRFATRWYADAAETRRRHARFAAAIEPMVLQCAGLTPAPWDDALLEALRRLEGSGVDWWLYGSAAPAVRGLAVAPADVDLLVSDARRAGRLFADLLVSPVERLDGWVARWAGRAFCGAVVEWLAEPHAALDDPAAPTSRARTSPARSRSSVARARGPDPAARGPAAHVRAARTARARRLHPGGAG